MGDLIMDVKTFACLARAHALGASIYLFTLPTTIWATWLYCQRRPGKPPVISLTKAQLVYMIESMTHFGVALYALVADRGEEVASEVVLVSAVVNGLHLIGSIVAFLRWVNRRRS